MEKSKPILIIDLEEHLMFTGDVVSFFNLIRVMNELISLSSLTSLIHFTFLIREMSEEMKQ